METACRFSVVRLWHDRLEGVSFLVCTEHGVLVPALSSSQYDVLRTTNCKRRRRAVFWPPMIPYSVRRTPSHTFLPCCVGWFLPSYLSCKVPDRHRQLFPLTRGCASRRRSLSRFFLEIARQGLCRGAYSGEALAAFLSSPTIMSQVADKVSNSPKIWNFFGVWSPECLDSGGEGSVWSPLLLCPKLTEPIRLFFCSSPQQNRTARPEDNREGRPNWRSRKHLATKE